jgi:hypothetical protein
MSELTLRDLEFTRMLMDWLTLPGQLHYWKNDGRLTVEWKSNYTGLGYIRIYDQYQIDRIDLNILFDQFDAEIRDGVRRLNLH